MKKRILALLLAVCIAASMLVLPASAAATNNTAVQMAITLGAMDTDQTGALNAVVTRGAFARMLTSFSTFRESVGAQGTVGTLYTDVPGTSPWAPYIRIAVQQGWLNGYTDGSYRPDNAVTLEEACTAVLKLMGYKMTELNGAFPNAQLNKASEIGLRTGLDRKQGEAMRTPRSCSTTPSRPTRLRAALTAPLWALPFPTARWMPPLSCSAVCRAPLSTARGHRCPLPR